MQRENKCHLPNDERFMIKYIKKIGTLKSLKVSILVYYLEKGSVL